LDYGNSPGMDDLSAGRKFPKLSLWAGGTFVLTPALSAVSAAMCSVQLVLPNGITLVPTREAGLVQIADIVMESML
jgi:hypothetical protein